MHRGTVLRLLIVAAAFAGVAATITARTSPTPDVFLEGFTGPDRQLAHRGRSHPAVGTTPALDLRWLDGEPEAGRPLVISFVARGCDGCPRQLRTLRSVSLVYAGRVDLAAVGPEDEAEHATDLLPEDGSVLTAEDLSGASAAELGIIQLPSTAILGPDGTVDAVWAEDVPLNFFYAFLAEVYGLEVN